MNQSTECLDEAGIDSLLQGNLAPHECQLVQQHLENCEQCRNRVESTIGSQQWWDDIASSLSEGAASLGTGTHRNADDSGLGDVNDQLASLGETRLREKLLDLLGPTDDPNMLGRIGSYEIVGLLGQGGMGVVFKGFDRSLNRFVAIKMLLPHLAASGAARKRFAREAQAVAAVVDDHVMAIHCVDQWQGVPYLVMTYSRGITLQKRLSDNGPLEVREILRIGMQAAKGLAAAHAQGIVHRDIKPANIFLDQNVERVQLMDFGLARAVDDASLTRTGVLAGTPQYMSPEQARAEAVDHRSDLFSLGSVMYAMCTGHAPFRAESSYSVLRLITDKEPRPIREINPDVPDWLDQFIQKLMAKQPEDRVASAQEVAELLEAFLAHVQKPTSNPLPIRFAQRPRIFSPSFLQRSFQGWMKMPRIISVGLLVVSFILIQLLTNISGLLQERDETRSLGLRVVTTLLPIAYLGAILAIAACVGAFRKSATDFRKVWTLATQHWKAIIAISLLIAISLGIYAFSLPGGEPFALPLKGSATDGKLKIGEPFPIIKGKDLDGREFVLGPGEYGDRATLIIFWSTWCGFCMDDMPHEIELTKKYASDGLRVIGVNGDTSEEVASKEVIKHGNPWRNLYEGSEQTISKQLGIKGWPALYLLDEQGKIVSETRYLRTGTFQSLGFGKKREVYGLDWTLERLLQRDPRDSARAQEMAINDPQTKSDSTLERATGPQAEDNPISQTSIPATEVITVNQKSLSGIWKAKQIISAGQVVPPEKAPDEFVFRRNQMIWKFTGKIKANDRVFDVEIDVTKSPKWITLRSRDPKRPQPVLGLIDFTGHELRIFTQRDAQGQPSTERPNAIGTGDEPGTDLMILELKSASVDEWRTYSIDECVSNLVAQWKKSSNDGEPSEEVTNAKVTEVGNKLAEDIDGRFGPCNLIEFDATSKRLIIDHTPQAHQKIEAFIKESAPVSAIHSVSDRVGDSVLVAESDQTKGIEAAKRHEQQAQEIANLPRFYLYSNYVSAWLDGMSDEADRSEANFEKAMNERLKPDTPSSTRITAWDEKRFLFGYDAPNLDGARGNTRIVNHYFSHENSFWQRQKTNKDAPLYSKLELPYVWKKVDANAFFHLRSARLEFPWGNTDGNIKFALVPLEFAEYQSVGEETVDGAKCWVVISKPRRCKLWFDQKSGRLLQMLSYVMQGVESTPFHETPEVEKLCGRKFETLDAFHDFGKATDRATFQRLAGLYGSLYFDELAHPIELTRFSEYREIAPGVWFPHQATDVFAGHSPSDNNKFRFSRGELRVITLETGRSLEETIAALVSEMPE